MTPESSRTITVEVNGVSYEREVEARKLLIHFLRDDLDLTGSHVGCDTGNCGACSVLLDGVLLKSCMLLAVQADGASIQTVEGLGSDGEQHAALHERAVDDHRARAAVAGVAPDVAAREVEVVADEVDEQLARLHIALVRRAVDRDVDVH